MKAYCYILFSEKLDRYYIGATEYLPEIRLSQHLEKEYGDKCFTANASDWILFHFIECRTMSQALKIESHIKRMKSKVYIENLKIYDALNEKLLNEYKNS